MRPALVCAFALSTAAPPAPRAALAQATDVPRSGESGWGSAVIHYGKWATAAAAVTLTVLGAHEHNASNRLFGQLLDICRADNAACTISADGRYVNPAAEDLYQQSLVFDRRARLRLIGGQASLLATAALFVLDLRHHTGGPQNKPFNPLGVGVGVDERTGGARVGLRVTF